MYVAIIFIFRDFGKRISTLSIVDGNFSDFEKSDFNFLLLCELGYVCEVEITISINRYLISCYIERSPRILLLRMFYSLSETAMSANLMMVKNNFWLLFSSAKP